MGVDFRISLMGKSFRSDDLNQALLLPPSLHDWLPEDHLARFLGSSSLLVQADDGRRER